MGVMAAILLSELVLSLLTLIAARKRQMRGWATAVLWMTLLLGVPLLGFMFVAAMPKKKPQQQERVSQMQEKGQRQERMQPKSKDGRGRSVKERPRGQEAVQEVPTRKRPADVRSWVAGLLSRPTPQQKKEREEAELARLAARVESGRETVAALREKDARYRSQSEPDMMRMMLNEMRLTRAERSLARDKVRLDDLNAMRSSAEHSVSGPDVRVRTVPDAEVRQAPPSVVTEAEGQGRLFALGHGTMGEDEFRGLLAANRIDLVVDVRSLPVSPHSPHFSGGDPDPDTGRASALESALESAGVSYQWLGNQFGSHHRREDSERKHLYMMWRTDGSPAGEALFGDDAECNDYCVGFNASCREHECIGTYSRVSEEEVERLLESGKLSLERRHEIADAVGEYMTYDEVRGRYDFQLNLANLRDCVMEGNRVLLLGRAADPLEGHCFSLLGRELAHPSDPLTEPMELCHLTRGGRICSQSELEGRMLSAQHLGSGPDDLDRAYRNSCSAIIGAKVFDRDMEKVRRQSSVRL